MCSSKNYYNDEYFVFNINDPILLFNNFESTYNKKNNIFILEKSKIKKKKVLYNICGTVTKIYNNGQ